MVLVVIGAVATGARTARADGTGVIAVGDGRGATAAAITSAIAGRSRRVAGDAVGEARRAVAAGAVPVDALARFKRVRELVDEGWRAYLRVAVEVAAQRLATARTEAEALVALPGGAEVYADAALRLGIVLAHLGRKQEANAIFALAIALDPDRPVTKAEFDPDAVDAIDALRGAAPGSSDKLRVTSEPPGALIQIDGREAGRAPVELEVARGQHLIVAHAPQHQPVVQGVVVGRGDAAVHLVLDPDRELVRLERGAELGLDEAAQQELVEATLRYADLDEVIVVAETVRRGAAALLAQRCAGLPGSVKCSAVVDIGFVEGGREAAARSAWEAMRTGELRYRPSVLAERAGRTGPRRCELCRSPWLWGGVGLALVAGAIVTVVATSGSRPPPIVGVDPSQFLPR